MWEHSRAGGGNKLNRISFAFSSNICENLDLVSRVSMVLSPLLN